MLIGTLRQKLLMKGVSAIRIITKVYFRKIVYNHISIGTIIKLFACSYWSV